MKKAILYLSIFSILLLNIRCKTKINNSITQINVYSISNIQGNKEDIKKVLFLASKDSDFKPESLYLIYYKIANDIQILHKKKLVAYYNIEDSNQKIFINNYSILRKELSFNDPNERRYLVTVINRTTSYATISITNSGDKNKLEQPVLVTIVRKDDK